MNILAFDTSTTICSVAIQYDNNIRSLHNIAPMQQGQFILPMIKELLESCSLELKQLQYLAYGCGPGSFTGIRLASSVAQGLAFALKLPVIPVSSLAAMAQTAYLKNLQGSYFLVAQDARMEKIYWAIYQIQHGIAVLESEEIICSPSAIPLPINSTNNQCIAIGDGWDKYRTELVTRLGNEPSLIHPILPLGEAILALASQKIVNNEWVQANQAMPVYLQHSLKKED